MFTSVNLDPEDFTLEQQEMMTKASDTSYFTSSFFVSTAQLFNSQENGKIKINVFMKLFDDPFRSVYLHLLCLIFNKALHILANRINYVISQQILVYEAR